MHVRWQRGQSLYALQQKDQAEIEAAQQVNGSLPMGTDTICFSPADVVIDTVTAHEDGNIFFSPTGKLPSPYSFLAITSDTASQDPLGANPIVITGSANFSEASTKEND